MIILKYKVFNDTMYLHSHAEYCTLWFYKRACTQILGMDHNCGFRFTCTSRNVNNCNEAYFIIRVSLKIISPKTPSKSDLQESKYIDLMFKQIFKNILLIFMPSFTGFYVYENTSNNHTNHSLSVFCHNTL